MVNTMNIINIINIMWDEEANVWVAVCDNLGIALESESYDELIRKVIAAAPEMAELNHVECTQLVFSTLNRQVLFA